MAFVKVALDVPLPALFDYALDQANDLANDHADIIGRRVVVPFGRRNVVGVALAVSATSGIDAAKIKPVTAVLRDVPALNAGWRALLQFCADYYHHPIGAAVLAALPAGFKTPAELSPLLWTRLVWSGPPFAGKKSERTRVALAARIAEAGAAGIYGYQLTGVTPKAIAHLTQWQAEGVIVQAQPRREARGGGGDAAHHLGAEAVGNDATAFPASAPTLHPEQAAAVAAITAALDAALDAHSSAPMLLHGVTGSGKTEVYLRAAAAALARGRQALLLVPEINLTPRLLQQVRERFPAQTIVALHSALNESERLHGWLLAHTGAAAIVLGTRLAVLTPMPRLGLIVVDEEHDASFKQQEGMRYSARDLAVFRAHREKLPVLLGSATPSLESYAHAESGRYHKLLLRTRAVRNAVLPSIRLIDLNITAHEHGVTLPVWAALKARLEAGEQSLVFLNRRGFAPVLSCAGCGWVSACTRCTSYLVLHRQGNAANLRSDGMLARGRLVCHHCGLDTGVPERCPTCGNVDVRAYGQGTQRLESRVAERFADARVLRIDRDSTARKGAAERLLAQAHAHPDAGGADILVGTQMLAKGHDFKRLTLVAALNVDTALFSADFRASERLFAQMMQVSGRAGRTEKPGEVLIQTRNPGHPLFQALLDHDYDRFARALLKERQSAGLPPSGFQAMLRAEAKTLTAALDFLRAAAAEGEDDTHVTVYDAVPMTITRLMNVERAQLMVESRSRRALQAFLAHWTAWLYGNAPRGVRWHLEVDPLDI